MTEQFFAHFLRRLTYKPGIKLDLNYDRFSEMVEFRATEMVPDATRTRAGKIELNFREVRPAAMFHEERDLMNWIHSCLRRREQHEVDEWFQLDGVAPFYPH